MPFFHLKRQIFNIMFRQKWSCCYFFITSWKFLKTVLLWKLRVLLWKYRFTLIYCRYICTLKKHILTQRKTEIEEYKWSVNILNRLNDWPCKQWWWGICNITNSSPQNEYIIIVKLLSFVTPFPFNKVRKKKSGFFKIFFLEKTLTFLYYLAFW